MKKNNTAEKSALDAERITKALQEGTEKTLKALVSEAVSKYINEEADEEEPEEVEDDSYDVEDVEAPETDAPETSDEQPEEGGEEDGEEGLDDDADDEWSDFEQYKVGDNDYDFTGVNGDELLKVYNKLGDDDQIFVKKQDDGTYEVKDEETGAELVIELNPDAEAEEDTEDNQEFDIDFDDEDSEEDGTEFDVDFDDEDSEEDGAEFDSEDEPADDDEIEIDLGDEDDEDELNEEDLGYTDSYQKDVFNRKPNMSEPADSKTTNDWDEGAPKGSEKPWAGKGDGKPFGKKVNEGKKCPKCGKNPCVCECGGEGCAPKEEGVIDENGGTIASTDARHMKKGQIAQHRPNAPAYDVRKVDSPLNESVKKIVEKAKAIQAENKQYKESLGKIKESLKEAAVLNVNLGKLVDILVNETTTKDEKKSILARFNNVKTIKEGAELYNSIKTELKESHKSSAPIVEKQFTASDKSLNETTIYSNGGNASLSLMERMDNLFKKKN